MKTNKVIPFILALLLLSSYGFGCNPFAKYTQKAKDSAVDSLTESILNKATNGTVHVDSHNGGTEFKISTKDGNSFTVGKKVELPDDLPPQIPIYKNSITKGASYDRENQRVILTFNSSDNASDVSKWYEDQLKGKDWKADSNMGFGKYQMVVYKKDKEQISVSVFDHQKDEEKPEDKNKNTTVILEWHQEK